MRNAKQKVIITIVLIAACVLSFFVGQYLQKRNSDIEMSTKYQNYQFSQVWGICDALDEAVSNKDRNAVQRTALALLELDNYKRNYMNRNGGNTGPGIWAELSDTLLWGKDGGKLQACNSSSEMTSEELDYLSELNAVFEAFLDRLSKEGSGKREVGYLSWNSFLDELNTHEEDLSQLL